MAKKKKAKPSRSSVKKAARKAARKKVQPRPASKSSGTRSGIVYSDPLREAIARREGRIQ